MNIKDYPIKIKKVKVNGLERTTRTRTNNVLDGWCKTKKAESSFMIDAANLWNTCLSNIREANSKLSAKKVIKDHCKSLPI